MNNLPHEGIATAGAFTDLVKYWSELCCESHRGLFIHPKDREVLDRNDYWLKHENACRELTFKTYLRSPRFGVQDPEFHFSLLPAPFIGDLENAKIVILLLNPGFSEVDYYAEYDQPEYRKRLVRNLRQDFRKTKFPFLHLDPNFCWAGGFRWWEGKLRKVLLKIAKERFEGDYSQALQFAAQRLALIELVPYHSATFSGERLLRDLPSAKAAQMAVQRLARRKEVALIATRKTLVWGLSEIRGQVVCYSAGEARGAHLTPNSRGGRLILEKLLED